MKKDNIDINKFNDAFDVATDLLGDKNMINLENVKLHEGKIKEILIPMLKKLFKLKEQKECIYDGVGLGSVRVPMDAKNAIEVEKLVEFFLACSEEFSKV